MGVSRTVPIFPLDGVLLCPGLALPLHIFEPRYRAMIAFALEDDGAIAMCTPVEGHSVGVEDDPPVHEICALGTIAQHETMPDGRSNILLQGVSRFRILEELPKDEAGFRIVRGEPLVEVFADDDVDIVSHATRLIAELTRLGVVADAEQLNALSTQQLADTAMLALPLPMAAKLALFSERRVKERLIGVLDQMAALPVSAPRNLPDDPPRD